MPDTALTRADDAILDLIVRLTFRLRSPREAAIAVIDAPDAARALRAAGFRAAASASWRDVRLAGAASVWVDPSGVSRCADETHGAEYRGAMAGALEAHGWAILGGAPTDAAILGERFRVLETHGALVPQRRGGETRRSFLIAQKRSVI